MKSRSKLFLFVLVIVVTVLCIAACGLGGGGGDTTTAPATTTTPSTTAPATTTAPADDNIVPGEVHPDAAGVTVGVSETTYTGKVITIGYAVRGKGPKVSITLSFQQIDPSTRQPLAGVAPVSQPVQAGTYLLTATFGWSTAATDADKAATLPDPIVKDFVVSPMTMNASNLPFGAKDHETFYYTGLSYDIADTEAVATGDLFNGLLRSYSVSKVDDAEGTNPVPMTGTVISEAGYYKITVSYTEPAGTENFANEAGISHDAILFIHEVVETGQVKRADGVTIDGVIDAEYLVSASLSSRYQEGGTGSGTFKPAGVTMGDPYEAINMINIYKGNAITELPDTSVTIYALWGVENEGTADEATYLYLALDVVDPAVRTRSLEYLSQYDPWLNDNIEIAYKVGGFDVPVLPAKEETYPTYSTVVVDAREKDALNLDGKNHSTIPQARSLYFDEIKSAVKHTSTGYVVELKIPAKSESYTGKYGEEGWERFEGETIGAGEFMFVAIQHNDLVAFGPDDDPNYDQNIPKNPDGSVIPKYANDADIVAGRMSPEWSSFESALYGYMYCSGNRNMDYLRAEGAGPLVFQFSSELAE